MGPPPPPPLPPPFHLCRPRAGARRLLLLPGGLVPLPGEGCPRGGSRDPCQVRQPALPPQQRPHLLPLPRARHHHVPADGDCTDWSTTAPRPVHTGGGPAGTAVEPARPAAAAGSCCTRQCTKSEMRW